MDEAKVVGEIRKIVEGAVEARRGLIAYSRMEAIEMDRRAREVEREALDQVRARLPGIVGDPQLHQVRTRLLRMDEHLEELAGRTEIQERSRALERDDITWRTFEDLLGLLGLR